nr:hypothetical protein [Tanacetum cinerariifolium]
TQPNGDALRKCILRSPYKPTTVVVQAVAATDDSLAIHEHITVKNYEKLSRGYNKVNPSIFKMSRQTYFGNLPEWLKFGTIVKQQHKLDEVSYHKLFDILKQYQKEVYELRAERLPRNANPLALVATAQANQDTYYQTSKSQKSYAPSSKSIITTRPHTTIRYKGKEIAKPITAPSESASIEDNDPEQAQRDKDMQKNLALNVEYFKKIYKPTNINLRTSSNSRNKNVDTTLRYKNNNQSGQFGNQRTMNVAGARENVDQFRAPTAQDMEILIQTCLMPLALKTQNDSFIFVHELKKEMHANLKYVESFVNKIDELESDKAEFSNMYDMILQESVSNEVMFTYLLSLSDLDALAELQCLYLHKVKECDCLAQKLSKQTESVNNKVHAELLQRFAKVENIRFLLKFPYKNAKNSELKKLIDKCKGKYVETKSDKPSVVRQPNAQQILKPSILGMYRIDNKTTQTRAPQSPQTFRNTNPHVSTSTGVNHKTNVSRPRLRSNQMKDKVVPNNSQVKLKKSQVEDHPRIPSIPNKKKSVTACNDSLNSRTLNANASCATCKKCLVDSDYFSCVTKMLNDVNARTKKPNVVLISTKKPKVMRTNLLKHPIRKKVSLKSTNQKPKSYYRMLYEKTSKAWKW